MSVVPMRGYLRGGAIRCIPGSNDIIIAPYAICMGDGGDRVLVVPTETTPSLTHAGTDRFYLYVAVTAGVAYYTAETAVPDAQKVFKSGDETKRLLGTFVVDGGDVVPFTTGAVPTEGMIGYLRGGTIRSDGSDIFIAPFALTMLSSNTVLQQFSEGLVTKVLPAEISGSGGGGSSTRYYVYVSMSGPEYDSTTAPDDAGVFKSTDENSVFVGKLEGGDIRSIADVIYVAPFKASILNASTGVTEHVETFAEMAFTPSLSANVWRYCYLSITNGVPAFASSATAPDVGLKYKSGDTNSLYLGCFCTQGTPHIRAFRKNGRVYTYMFGRAYGGNDILDELSISKSVVVATSVSLARLVPPTSRLTRMRLSMSTGSSGTAGANADGSATVGLTSSPPTQLSVWVHVDNTRENQEYSAFGDVETADDRTVSLITYQSLGATAATIVVLGFTEAGDLNS